MLGAVPSHSYLDTRVTLMGRRLLTAAAIERLIEDQPAGRDRLLHRAGLTGRPHDPAADIAPLQPAFMGRLLQEANVLLRPLRGAARAFLQYWIGRFELINLKILLRAKTAGWPPESIRRELVDLGPLATMPTEGLLGTDDIAELLRRLRVPRYAAMAHRALRSYEETGDPFVLEAVLDRQYFEGLKTRAQALAGADREQVDALIDKLLDEITLVWLLRYRFAFGLAPAHAYFLLPGGGRHLAPALAELVALPEPGAVLERLPAGLRGIVAGAEAAADIEQALTSDRLRLAERILGRTRFNLGRALAYLMLRERELSRLHAVMEGTDLQLAPAIIRAAAGLPPAAA